MIVRPYGDTLDDGAVQLSFTLPLSLSARAEEAARQLVRKLGFSRCEIAHAEALSEGFTLFVAYGYTRVGIDPDKIVVDEGAVPDAMGFDEVNKFISENIGRKIIVVGACTGSDAHTVGIDAIMNMKGYNHHYGLERYPMVAAHNLGAQVPNDRLIAYAEEVGADAILVSQSVTQKNMHLKNLKAFVKLLEKTGQRERYILIAGSPRMKHQQALALGFDAGFGKGTYAEHAATFIARQMTDPCFRRDRLPTLPP